MNPSNDDEMRMLTVLWHDCLEQEAKAKSKASAQKSKGQARAAKIKGGSEIEDAGKVEEADAKERQPEPLGQQKEAAPAPQAECGDGAHTSDDEEDDDDASPPDAVFATLFGEKQCLEDEEADDEQPHSIPTVEAEDAQGSAHMTKSDGEEGVSGDDEHEDADPKRAKVKARKGLGTKEKKQKRGKNISQKSKTCMFQASSWTAQEEKKKRSKKKKAKAEADEGPMRDGEAKKKVRTVLLARC